MGYNIEVSISILKHPDVTEYEQEVIKLAEQYLCNNHYKFNEYEENVSQIRNHSVINLNFDNVNHFSEFIKKIKQMKGIYIESIYNDDIKSELLYASQYYLTIMDKKISKEFKKNRRERSYSEDEKLFLDPLLKKWSKTRGT